MDELEKKTLDVAKERQGDTSDVVTLSTGVRARLKPVSASLVDAVTSRIPDPAVPIWHDPDKDRDEPNPLDPKYVASMVKANHDRGLAAVDACIMFGVELVDPIPADDTWVKKLTHLGITFDQADPFERDFAYKKYVAVGSSDLNQVMELSGVPQAEVNRQVKVLAS